MIRLWPAAALLLLVPRPAAAQFAPPSMLDPQGREAGEIASLFWVFLVVAVVVWALVAAAVALALRRRGGEAPRARREGRARSLVAVAVAATAVVVLALAFASYRGQRAIAATGEPELTIRLTARQWWWEARYEAATPSDLVVTANELHIPVGTVVRLELHSGDVIHSFFVPQLAGKQDLVPGRTNELRILAERAGVYRGACAEYCGYQHAHMGLLVVAEPRAAFDAWLAAQRRPAPPPDTDERRRGLDVLTSRGCMLCHAVRGTTAGGRSGPDLTHLFSRRTIAAGTLQLTRGALAAWIADPQGIKPGANMPAVTLEPAERDALLAYLETLR